MEFGQHREHQLWKVWDCLRIALDKLPRLAATYEGALQVQTLSCKAWGFELQVLWSRRFGKAIGCAWHPHAHRVDHGAVRANRDVVRAAQTLHGILVQLAFRSNCRNAASETRAGFIQKASSLDLVLLGMCQLRKCLLAFLAKTWFMQAPGCLAFCDTCVRRDIVPAGIQFCMPRRRTLQFAATFALFSFQTAARPT